MMTFKEYFLQYKKENEDKIKDELSFIQGKEIVDCFDKEEIEERYWVTITLEDGEILRVYSVGEDEKWIGRRIKLGCLRRNLSEYMIVIQISGGFSNYLPLVKWTGCSATGGM